MQRGMVARVVHLSQPGVSDVEDKLEEILGDDALAMPDGTPAPRPGYLADGTPDPATWGLGVEAYQQQQAFLGGLADYKPGGEVPRE